MATQEDERYLNEKHSAYPEPGDCWVEMMVSVSVVLVVTDTYVIFCKEKKREIGGNRWVWDLEKSTKVSRQEFRKEHRYDSIPGFWARVYPGRFLQVVQEYSEAPVQFPHTQEPLF